MLQFAYGSNLDFNQTRARCRSARFVSKALLPDYRLCFPRYGLARRCGVASIEPAEGDHVWGVVYEIPDDEVSNMDKAEDFNRDRPYDQNSYYRVEIEVLPNGDPATPITVFTYIAVPQPKPPLPNADYRDTIVRGAIASGLPEEYVKRLEAIEIA